MPDETPACSDLLMLCSRRMVLATSWTESSGQQSAELESRRKRPRDLQLQTFGIWTGEFRDSHHCL